MVYFIPYRIHIGRNSKNERKLSRDESRIPKMKIIGLCGGSGSGKSTVAAIFAAAGVPVLDADAIYHEMISKSSPCTKEIAEALGNEVLTPEGALDRPKTAELVFSGEGSEERRKKLNAITHRYILDEVRRRIAEEEKKGTFAVLFDAPLLFESGFENECNAIICVSADENVRLSRIVQRDGIDRETARLRFATQFSDNYLISHSDYHIANNGDTEELTEKVEGIVRKILSEK
mgnify:FL=1